jgi:predicted dehydrogenase
MTQTAVRIGVIGLGSVARMYVPHIRRLNIEGLPCRIVVACDIDPSRRDKALAWDIAEFTTDWRELVGRKDIDLIVILTAMQVHGEITRAALEAGHNVLVEKPVSMDLGDATEIVALSKKTPGFLLCAPHVTLSPVYQDMWRAIQDGRIGRPTLARGFYGWSGPSWGAWFYQPGGGPMFDLGVYNVTTLTGLIGPARRVMAMSGIAIPERIVDNRQITVETDDNSQFLIDFGDACFGVVTTGFTIQKYRTPGIEIYGTKGTIQMIGEDWDPKGHEIWENDRGAWEVHDHRGNWPWTDGIRDAVAAIHEGRKPVNNPDHALHVLEIMVKGLESGRTGQALPITTTFTPARFDRPSDRIAPHLDHAPAT